MVSKEQRRRLINEMDIVLETPSGRKFTRMGLDLHHGTVGGLTYPQWCDIVVGMSTRRARSYMDRMREGFLRNWHRKEAGMRYESDGKSFFD